MYRQNSVLIFSHLDNPRKDLALAPSSLFQRRGATKAATGAAAANVGKSASPTYVQVAANGPSEPNVTDFPTAANVRIKRTTNWLFWVEQEIGYVVFMMNLVAILVVGVALAAVALSIWRLADHRADRAEMNQLLAMQPDDPSKFTANVIAGLPEPARRYFTFAIMEGTPLLTVAEIEMRGQFSLGNRDAPNYMDMEASQVLAAPVGFVWKMSGGSGLMRVSGSDSGRWTRFWLAGLAPVARIGHNSDHARAAFGRYVAEAAFWTPAALLPGPDVTWEAVDQNTAQFTINYEGIAQSVDVTVDAEGRPIVVQFQRWSNANPEGVHRLQPFGGFLTDFQEVQGFRVPMHVEAGNFFGTDEYFPFFIADVSEVRFPIP